MAKYKPSRYRCSGCGDYYHTKTARNRCERDHGIIRDDN